MMPLAISLRAASQCLTLPLRPSQSPSLSVSQSVSLSVYLPILPGSYDEAEIAVFLLFHSFLFFLLPHAFLHLQKQTQRNERNGNEIKMQKRMK